MPKFRRNIAGVRYERLVVLEEAGWHVLPSGGRRSLWKCLCDCGSKVIVSATSLTEGNTRSCGCLHTEVMTTHEMSKKPEYKVFDGMWERCNNPNSRYYHVYGGAGIKVEGSWAAGSREENFLSFFTDMGERPTPSHTIERVDVKKGYSKENCIWTDDLSLQSYNQRMDKRNTSGRTGVRWDDKRSKWCAAIGFKGVSVNLGRFDKFEDAVHAREQAELKYFGFNKE